ncbi:FMN-dependent NADH-azoreductase [Acinetobacter nosocomialis]|uniref:FMN-dependent NADH-azoreductase n=1 Tax=Acinetobacter nosocomialis TaxID=106654 RepID=UPI0024DEEF92|nr:NAD(P)H-dependent oxidoreductase [Acinetobacter nosocomialis]MDO7218857.1 NAD(P)H-dependent oxidoreductase [Acinetobacter nosocomialis]
MKILHIDSSILGEQSISRKLAASFIERLNKADHQNEITYRDIVKDPINHLTGEIAAGFRNLNINISDENVVKEHQLSDELVAEFLNSELIIISAPMYNFSIPTQLKAWFDRIAQVGKTFKYTENGPVGLSEGRKVVILSARGGFYSKEPLSHMDFQEKYITAFFNFLGIKDIYFVRAEGTSKAPAIKDIEIQKALSSIDEVINNLSKREE